MPSIISSMAKVVNEAASAYSSYGYTYSVVGSSCTTTTSQHTCQTRSNPLHRGPNLTGASSEKCVVVNSDTSIRPEEKLDIKAKLGHLFGNSDVKRSDNTSNK
jgi:hypothetical protein